MKIVRINVKTDNISTEEITQDSKYFLFGARGLTSHIVHDEVPAKCDPLGPENKLVIANGILTGSSFPNSGRTSVGAKSPLTNGIKEANVGGRPAMMLARRGLRALILENISSEALISFKQSPSAQNACATVAIIASISVGKVNIASLPNAINSNAVISNIAISK